MKNVTDRRAIANPDLRLRQCRSPHIGYRRAYGNESYTFDDVGNRTSSHLSTTYGYQSGQFNRLTSTDSATYQFDANGNTTQRDDGVDIWGFDWDHENRMTTATVGTDSAVYTYDALGRRVRRNVGGGIQDTKFIHDGHDVLVDDHVGTLTKYVNGPGIDNKLRVQQGSTVNYFLGDHLGSTNALTDASGAITSQTAYDSFGNQTASISTRYGFTGRERDDFTRLTYYRARFYDPNAGRFISEDPIGFSGGYVNLYGYVGNNPANYTDPSGLFPFMGGPLIPKRLPWSNGSEFANWGDEKVNTAQRFYGGYDPPFSFNPLDPSNPHRFFGTMRGFCDMFRVGEGLGQALYAPNENGWGRAAFVMMDAGRASGLAGVMLGGVAGRVGASNRATFPNNPGAMDDAMGFSGTRIPDGPTPIGRGKVQWKPSDHVTITFEQHPYHPGAPAWHRGPHWHVDTPGSRHVRYLPGDAYPGQ